MKKHICVLISLFSFMAYSRGEPQEQSVNMDLWGTHIPGVFDHLNTTQKVMALTFDACGSRGDGYDEELINFLRGKGIPATLFVSGLWIKKNPEHFLNISQDPLFRIANHGTRHRQLSVDGKGEFNWGKTYSAEDIEEEVVTNAETIDKLTGIHPRYFRSGTAFYDPGSLNLIKSWNYEPVGFSHSADGGATFSKKTIVDLGIKNATTGAIYLFHMNWPNKETFEGVRELVPKLKEMGYSFAYVEDFDLEQKIIKK